jgi:hypothetical protein
MTHRPIAEIAREIIADWSQIGKGVSPYAKPYLDAMLSLRTVQDAYGYDSGSSVVLYGLSNMSTYRGETARRLKAELKALVS